MSDSEDQNANLFMEVEESNEDVDSQEEDEEEEGSSGSQENSDAESVASSVKEGMPEALSSIFETKSVTLAQDKTKRNASLFTKTKAEQVATDNIDEAKRRKAEELFQKHSLFASGTIAANAKKIQPLNNGKLEQKERQKQRE